jgi:hypothetical protein
MPAAFIAAIHSMNRIRLAFYSKEDGTTLVRTCAPMDYGPSRRTRDQSDRFHVWDYDSDTGRHTLSLLPNQVVRYEVLNVQFNPSEFVTWNTATSPWFIPRHWGAYS